jgi:predicted acyl esterase
MSDLVGPAAAAAWLRGAQKDSGERAGHYRACQYPGCRSVVRRGSQEISAWRELTDYTNQDQRRVLLCPEHALAWDEYARQEYLRRYGGDPDEPVLHH